MVNKFISIKELFPELYKTIPGLIKGTYYAVTGQTSSAKTKFTKFLFVSHAYKYCKANDIPLKILYFALEESIEKFWITMVCDILYEKHQETITYYQYKGYHIGMTDLIKQHVEEIENNEISDMKKVIEVVDFIYNPTGVFKKVKDVMETVGKKSKETEDGDELGNKWKSFEFVYDNPDTHVIVVLDHISCLTPEKSTFSDVSTPHLAISKW